MRTLFVNRLEPTTDQRALYNWFVANGHTPEDVRIVCKRFGEGGNHALVRFATGLEAGMAAVALEGKKYNSEKHGVQIFLSHTELEPPTDPRWEGLWLNWIAKSNPDTAPRGTRPETLSALYGNGN
jgi:hypothetical protein